MKYLPEEVSESNQTKLLKEADLRVYASWNRISETDTVRSTSTLTAQERDSSLIFFRLNGFTLSILVVRSLFKLILYAQDYDNDFIQVSVHFRIKLYMLEYYQFVQRTEEHYGKGV